MGMLRCAVVVLVTAGLVFPPWFVSGVAADPNPLIVSKRIEADLPAGLTASKMVTAPDGSAVFVVGMHIDRIESVITGSSVYKIDPDNGNIVASAFLPGRSPNSATTGVAFDSARNRLLVAMSSDLFMFAGDDLHLIESNFAWDRSLYALLSDPTTARIFGLTRGSSESAPRVVEISAVDGAVIGEVNYSSDVGSNPPYQWYATQRLAIDPTGTRLYALPEERAEMLAIDLTSMTVINTAAVGSPDGSIALSPTAREVFVSDPANGVLQRYSMTDLRPMGSTVLEGRCPGAIALDAIGDRAVVGNPCGGNPLQLFDPVTAKVLSAPFDILSNGMALWMSADGRRLHALSSSGVAFAAYEIQTREEVRAEERAALPLPGAPRRVATSLSGNTVTITWRRPANAQASKVKRYRVTGKPGAVNCTSKAPKTVCKISGLVAGRTYAFTVRAENARGRGPSEVSDFVNIPGAPAVVTPEPAPPVKPEPTFS